LEEELVKSNFGLARAPRSVLIPATTAALIAALGWAVNSSAGASAPTFLSSLGPPQKIASTVPGNGDVNPYGVAVVPSTGGKLVKGDVLVSNFNDKANVQGTGKTIVELSPTGPRTTFAELGALPGSLSCPGGIGLTTALLVLPGGWVVVGSLPAAPSGALPNVSPAGCLIVLNNAGKPVETWSNLHINGPWDMTEVTTNSGAGLFVSNARPTGPKGMPQSGDCSVARVDISLPAGKLPTMTSTTVVADGISCKANKVAFVLAPTGLALSHTGTLYVAETASNRITAIPDALTRTKPVKDGTSTLFSGGALNLPLGMAMAPNGDLIVMNGGDGNAVEITPQGKQVATRELIKNGAGDLFGVTLAPGGQQLFFVNDGTNALEVAHAM
jgi:hypothetical protein